MNVPSKASEAIALCQVTPSRYLMSAPSFGNLPLSQGSCCSNIICSMRLQSCAGGLQDFASVHIDIKDAKGSMKAILQAS